jgi:peptidoglycan/LPS O-acetylase OafA/YrhL
MPPSTANPSGLLRSNAVAEPFAPQLAERIPSLDGMRAVCILLVVTAHLINPGTHPQLSSSLGHVGNYGVRIFFLISGFLITGLLLKEYDRTGTISLKAFYLRRAIRIFPAFYIYVGVVCLLALFTSIELSGRDVISALTYTMNYQYVRGWYLNHTWSLSVEEQFYLLWPAVFLLARPLKAMKFAAAALLLAPVIRGVMYLYFNGQDTALSRHFETVSDALASGCLLAGYYNRLGREPLYAKFQASGFAIGTSIALLVFSAVSFKIHPALYYVVGQSVANIGGLLLLDYVVRRPQTLSGKILNLAPLAIVGVWSYSIYLWQELFLDFSKTGFGIPWPMNLLCVLVVSALSYYGVEQQFRKLRKYVS